MNCNNCGNQLPQGANVCPMCGAPVVQQPNMNGYNGQVQQPYGQPNMNGYNGQGQPPYGQPNMNGYNGQVQPPYGQPNMNGYNGQMQPPYGQSNMNGGFNNQAQPLPMNWYKFVIYFQLIVNAILNIVSAFTYFTGAQYGGSADLVYSFYGGLKVIDVIMGVVAIALAAAAIYVRQCLANYKKDATKKYIILLVANTLITVLYVIIASVVTGLNLISASIVSNVLTTVVIAILSYMYFQKREFMFVN